MEMEHVMARPKCKARESLSEGRVQRTTRSATTEASRRAVFDTTELLELILLQLPIKDTFRLQRVCRQWRDIISGSTPIRQKLFLQGRNIKREHWVLKQPAQADESLGLYVEACPDGIHFHHASEREREDKGIRKATPARLNPLFEVDTAPALKHVTSASRLWHQRGERVSFTLALILGAAEASWRHMQLTDPPTLSMAAGPIWELAKPNLDTHGWLPVELSNKNGVTLGEIMDAALHPEDYYRKPGVSYRGPRMSPLQRLQDAIRSADKMWYIEDEYGEKARICIKNTIVWLDNMVIPSADEWATVRDRYDMGTE